MGCLGVALGLDYQSCGLPGDGARAGLPVVWAVWGWLPGWINYQSCGLPVDVFCIWGGTRWLSQNVTCQSPHAPTRKSWQRVFIEASVGANMSKPFSDVLVSDAGKFAVRGTVRSGLGATPAVMARSAPALIPSPWVVDLFCGNAVVESNCLRLAAPAEALRF